MLGESLKQCVAGAAWRADPAAAAAQAHDRAAQARLRALDDTLARLKAEQAELTAQWQREKEEMRRLQSIKNEIDRVNLDIQARAHPCARRARRACAPRAVISACLADVTRARAGTARTLARHAPAALR